MPDAVIIKHFCVTKILFRNKRKTKNNVFKPHFASDTEVLKYPCICISPIFEVNQA